MRVMLADARGDADRVTRTEVPRFAALLRRAGVSPYVDVAAGGHTVDYLRAELPRVLRFLVNGR
jgi:hypothetical protein